MGPFGSNIKVDNFIDSGIPVLNGSNLQGIKLNEDSFKSRLRQAVSMKRLQADTQSFSRMGWRLGSGIFTTSAKLVMKRLMP